MLCLLGSGRTVKEISAELRLSPKTISTIGLAVTVAALAGCGDPEPTGTEATTSPPRAVATAPAFQIS